MRVTLVLSAETELPVEFGMAQHEEHAAQALHRHQRRLQQLQVVADRSAINLSQQNPVLARLVVAADQFIVARPQPATGETAGETHSLKSIPATSIRLSPDRKTVITGYPWFADWGRTVGLRRDC